MKTNIVTDAELATFGKRTNELYRRLTEGTLPAKGVLDGLQRLIEGSSKEQGSLVDLDAGPFVPDGWSVHKEDQLPGRLRGTIDLATARLGLYLPRAQKSGVIVGDDLRTSILADRPVLNANALDFFLKPENQRLIPEEWKTQAVFFWGTIYRNSGGLLCVRCLIWGGGGWLWSCRWLGDRWLSGDPAAVSASS